MIKESNFGLKQIVLDDFKIKNFKTKSEPFEKLLITLEDCLISYDEEIGPEMFVGLVRTFFENYDKAFEKLKGVMSVKDVSMFIDLNYDLLYLIGLYEPRRHETSMTFRYRWSKTYKEANQLEYSILSTIAEQFRIIAELNNASKAKIAEHLELSEIFSSTPKKHSFWDLLRSEVVIQWPR